MKKIILIILVGLFLTGCGSVITPSSLPDTPSEGTGVEETETPQEAVAHKPEKTPEEKAEAERIRKEKDEELRIKLEKANEERLERMRLDAETTTPEEAEYEAFMKDVADIEAAAEAVKNGTSTETPSEEYLKKEELMAKQRADIRAAKVTNKPHVLKEEIEREILEVTNRYRAQEGMAPLVWSDTMHRYARSYNLYMFTYSIWEHNIVYPSAENLYMSGGNDPEKIDAEFIVNQWWTSPGHKKNLLHPEAKTMGAAVLIGTTKHPVTGEVMPVLFATQHFYRD